MAAIMGVKPAAKAQPAPAAGSGSGGAFMAGKSLVAPWPGFDAA